MKMFKVSKRFVFRGKWRSWWKIKLRSRNGEWDLLPGEESKTDDDREKSVTFPYFR